MLYHPFIEHAEALCFVRATLAVHKTKVGNRHNAKQCSVLYIVGVFNSPPPFAVGTAAIALGLVVCLLTDYCLLQPL